MIDGEDEYALNNKSGGPLRVHRSHSILKNKTNRLSHKEHRTRNDVGNDHSRDSVAPRLSFLFFLSFFFFSLNSLSAKPSNPLTPPHHGYL